MANEFIRAYCRQCKHEQSFARVILNHPLHAVLTVVSAGLWSISWISLAIGARLFPWRCRHCGWHDPQFKGVQVHPPGALRWPAEKAHSRHRRSSAKVSPPAPPPAASNGGAMIAVGLVFLDHTLNFLA